MNDKVLEYIRKLINEGRTTLENFIKSFYAKISEDIYPVTKNIFVINAIARNYGKFYTSTSDDQQRKFTNSYGQTHDNASFMLQGISPQRIKRFKDDMKEVYKKTVKKLSEITLQTFFEGIPLDPSLKHKQILHMHLYRRGNSDNDPTILFSDYSKPLYIRLAMSKAVRNDIYRHVPTRETFIEHVRYKKHPVNLTSSSPVETWVARDTTPYTPHRQTSTNRERTQTPVNMKKRYTVRKRPRNTTRRNTTNRQSKRQRS